MNKKENIFSIGDKTNNGIISKFEINTYGVRVFFEEKPENYHVSLNSIKHSKQKLFKTFDGVDVFEGDIFWGVNSVFKMWDLQVTNLKYPLSDITDEYKLFSTREKAKEFIILNKPCLSLQEAMNNNNASLKELVKSRL